MKRKVASAVVGVAILASVSTASPAAAAWPGFGWGPITAGTPQTAAAGFLSPLSLEVDLAGSSYLSQNFSGQLTRISRAGAVSTIVNAPGQEITAVSDRKNIVYYVEAAQDHSSSHLKALLPNGGTTTLADLAAYEKHANPDSVNTYGFTGLSPACAAQFPADFPATYTGTVDTHAYASLALGDGVYIADAGANTITHVDYSGAISTTAVLPPTPPVVVTAELAAAQGLPACSAGHPYRFEPVPTDVELGADGYLYVTSLPGGPEDASLGARGSVYRVSAQTGGTTVVATGFVGATGLAVSRLTNTIYVAELFGGQNGTGQISVVVPGKAPRPLVAINSPAAIELRLGKLWVTTDAFVPDATGAPQPIGRLSVVPLTGGLAALDLPSTDNPSNGSAEMNAETVTPK